MQQAPCLNCSQQQLWNSQGPDPNWNAKNLNGSNMSLNLPPFYPQQFDMNGTTWMNNGSYRKPDGYPYNNFGMIPNGEYTKRIRVYKTYFDSFDFKSTAYPFPVSRPHSRVPSRATSPALSSKSRKSSMSARNIAAYRHSYMEQRLTDEESSESMTSYMDEMDMRRKHDKRDSAGRSIRSSRQSLKSSPQRSFDEDSEAFSRRSYRQSARDRRASSAARSVSSRSDRRPSQRVRSDSTQDSETELGTKALVQAKIREKVAQAQVESMDESSSDLWKPKSVTPVKTEKPIVSTNNNKKEVSAPTTNNKATTAPVSKLLDKKMNSVVNKPTPKIASKPGDRRKSIERVVKPKTTNETQAPVKIATKPVAKPSVTSNGVKPAEPMKKEPVKKEPIKKDEPSASEEEASETDLANVPDTAPEGPPKTPDYDWTCEYCTFENEANVKICAVCCKTPSAKAVRKQANPDEEKTINGRLNDSADISKEGRSKKNSRKISFWPGTKPK